MNLHKKNLFANKHFILYFCRNKNDSALKKLLFILLFFVSLSEIYAAPASRTLHTETLAGGSVISYYVRGDEKYRYFLSTDNYTMLKNEDGVFVYAQKDENENLIAGNVCAHNETERTPAETAFLKSITPFLTYSETQIAAFLEKWQDNSPQKAKPAFTVADGNPNSNPDTKNNRHTHNLVILVEFSDKHFVVQNPQQAFYDMLNQQNYSYNGATGSVRDYFSDNSMGEYTPEFTVVGPVTLGNYSNYTSTNDNLATTRNRQMIMDACNAVNGFVNFADYDSDNDGEADNICVIYAGKNSAENKKEDLIWPHCFYLSSKSTLKLDGKIIYNYMCTSELRGEYTTAASMCGIGTFTHEFSHILGLPDMYNDAVSYCLEEWDIMDGGIYNNDGRTPPAYSSYERYFMGWLTPGILDFSENISLEDLKTSNHAFIIANGTLNFNGFVPSPVQFFLLENRQNTSWDEYLPHHGLLVWRINYNAADWKGNIPNNSRRKGIYIIPADGKSNLLTQDGDSFPGTSGKTSYAFQWTNGAYSGTSITNISEESVIVSFDYIDSTITSSHNYIENNNFKIWTNQKTLYISGIDRETQIEVIQADGRTIFRKKTSSFNTEIPVSQAGMYILKLQNNEKKSIKKFVIY